METKWYHYVLAFIAGGIFVNVVPHFVNGISGRPFPSGFSDPPGAGLSSPLQNILWATINFLIAYAFVHFGKLSQRNSKVYLGYFFGAVSMSLYLASYFSSLNLAQKIK